MADHRKLIIVGPSQIYGSTHYHLDGPTNAQELVVFLHGIGDACYHFELMANALAFDFASTLRAHRLTRSTLLNLLDFLSKSLLFTCASHQFRQEVARDSTAE